LVLGWFLWGGTAHGQCRSRVSRVCVPWFFFFQAEDGIRALTVTGVQTCALPISPCARQGSKRGSSRSSRGSWRGSPGRLVWGLVDRKSTRLNSSHSQTSYAVFCLKKKNGGAWTAQSPTRSRPSAPSDAHPSHILG